jgi:hypothetical protein
MAFPFQFIFTTFYQCCWLFCDGSNVTCFMDKLLIRLLQLCTVLTHGRFAMGNVLQSKRFYSLQFPWLCGPYLYTIYMHLLFHSIFYFYIRYSESDYRVLTKFKCVETDKFIRSRQTIACCQKNSSAFHGRPLNKMFRSGTDYRVLSTNGT